MCVHTRARNTHPVPKLILRVGAHYPRAAHSLPQPHVKLYSKPPLVPISVFTIPRVWASGRLRGMVACGVTGRVREWLVWPRASCSFSLSQGELQRDHPLRRAGFPLPTVPVVGGGTAVSSSLPDFRLFWSQRGSALLQGAPGKESSPLLPTHTHPLPSLNGRGPSKHKPLGRGLLPPERSGELRGCSAPYQLWDLRLCDNCHLCNYYTTLAR